MVMPSLGVTSPSHMAPAVSSRSLKLLKTARHLPKGFLQVSDRSSTFYDGLLDPALVAVANVPEYRLRKLVLRAHDADDCPANRIARVSHSPKNCFCVLGLEHESAHV